MQHSDDLHGLLRHPVEDEKATDLGTGHTRTALGSCGQYRIATRVRPCAGAVAPARVRSRPAISSPRLLSLLSPRPTSASLPTLFRTMCFRNAVASMR